MDKKYLVIYKTKYVKAQTIRLSGFKLYDTKEEFYEEFRNTVIFCLQTSRSTPLDKILNTYEPFELDVGVNAWKCYDNPKQFLDDFKIIPIPPKVYKYIDHFFSCQFGNFPF